MTTRTGAAVWIIGAAQFFLLHVIVERAWARPYSWLHNNISDLGQVTCATPPDGRYICSPLHDLMNASFIVGGICIIAGAALTAEAVAVGKRGHVGAVLLAITGAAWVLVGLFPADVDENLHVLGAVIIFACGNAGLVLLGLARSALGVARPIAVALGIAGFLAMLLHFGGVYLGLGMGGMERVTAFALPLWILLAGGVLLARRARVAP
ncbi:DUF998 domain-containing protein [Pseudonocardia sp. TRM90224]|uniref:DUF998 domain-containing protein n=1 Tax=Pseudonocardia sp. TRM90224 TaxID=2812678 RepID=UPI001E2D00FD|nr:DUF998 domain-containing protein [Pseudonocardia sp. TRM90224]